MNIIVLCGGLSAERDVSLKSGAMVKKALLSLGHNAVLIDLFFGYRGQYTDPAEIFSHTQDDAPAVISETAPDLKALIAARGEGDRSRIGKNVIEVCAAADLVFLALHGADGEDGKVQAMLDLHGVRYTGTGTLGSACAMNKTVAKKLMASAGVRVPGGVELHISDRDLPDLPMPWVVKPRSGGSSVGTNIVRDISEVQAAIDAAFACEDYILVENYIKGRECDVGVLDGKALPVIEICPKTGFYDYKNKYQAGGAEEFCPADLPEDITEKLQSMAETVFNALHLECYARMDFIVDEQGECWCLEANTLPGMTPTSLLPQEAAVVGMSYAQLCEKIIELALEKYEK